MKRKLLFAVVMLLMQTSRTEAQNLIYVDKNGVMRYTKTKQEASFFGVNYTVPFAYGYRSLKALGVDHEKAIDADVYHFARLGLDAFRVHVWDTEITDSLGNLKENEHLRLFDYLISKLKERKIKIFLTPLAFWGNGYPERDQNTGSFSSKWNKQLVLVTEDAIKAQENYLKQLLRHVNPYTKKTYGQDQDVIALEINNEPHHSGTKQKAAEYIDRMVKAVKSTGWTKPIFYNISESPNYAEPVAKSSIQGVSFQWYPTGLVANRRLKGNYLPNVDHYRIPFDTIPAYRNKARMVYEFDAGDVYDSYIYPAMSRSFRTAGFQWATQFAYDPMATAYGNTEYQTHYLNLAYTPSKAISILIASEVFHRVPRGKSFGKFPDDTLFDVFRVSYHQSLSEMNTPEKFYYSNTTNTGPVHPDMLKNVAGVGNSAVVQYSGTGAYFLDKIGPGKWRLEVMPDAVAVRDPFERASPKKEVTVIRWKTHEMSIRLPDLAGGFEIRGADRDNQFRGSSPDGKFNICPGVYFLDGRRSVSNKSAEDALSVQEFYAPVQTKNEVLAVHEPFSEVSAGRPFQLHAKLIGVDSGHRLNVEIRNSSNKWKTVGLQKVSGYDYVAEVPADMVLPGLINYRFIIQKGNEFVVFPGAHKGDPYAWDQYINESWQVFVAAEGSPIRLFYPTSDRNILSVYNADWRRNSMHYTTSADDPMRLMMKVSMEQPSPGQFMAAQLFVGDKIAARGSELSSLDEVVIRARAHHTGNKLIVRLITRDAVAYATEVTPGSDFSDHIIPLSRFVTDSFLLMPRPYPGFQPLYFSPQTARPLRIGDLDKLQIIFLPGTAEAKPLNIEIATIELRRREEGLK